MKGPTEVGPHTSERCLRPSSTPAGAPCPGARFGCRAEKGFRPLTPAPESHPHPAGAAATGVSAGGGDASRSGRSQACRGLARLQCLFALLRGRDIYSGSVVTAVPLALTIIMLPPDPMVS
jgi:hypothetical protein